jgi:hypothetical protein
MSAFPGRHRYAVRCSPVNAEPRIDDPDRRPGRANVTFTALDRTGGVRGARAWPGILALCPIGEKLAAQRLVFVAPALATDTGFLLGERVLG